MTEQNETERKAFEEWAESEGFNLTMNGEFYISHIVQTAYKGWQTRATLPSDGWLQDAVVVLEEGAEYQEGDVIFIEHGLWGEVRLPSKDNNFTEPMAICQYKNEMKPCKGQTIIQRNNLPVVYKPKERKHD